MKSFGLQESRWLLFSSGNPGKVWRSPRKVEQIQKAARRTKHRGSRQAYAWIMSENYLHPHWLCLPVLPLTFFLQLLPTNCPTRRDGLLCCLISWQTVAGRDGQIPSPAFDPSTLCLQITHLDGNQLTLCCWFGNNYEWKETLSQVCRLPAFTLSVLQLPGVKEISPQLLTVVGKI